MKKIDWFVLYDDEKIFRREVIVSESYISDAI